MTREIFLKELALVKLENVFNPYSDRCPTHDIQESPFIRIANLAAALDVAWEKKGGSLWLGRDLGYRGGRRTGLPLTDEVSLRHYSHAWGGLVLHKATASPQVGERTAAVIWSMLQRIGEPVFLWNLFPFHPHEEGFPLSNRPHSTAERRIGRLFLLKLLNALQPARIVAIGGDASSELMTLGLAHVRVRHPSYGGTKDFCTGIETAYCLRPNTAYIQGALPI